VAISHLEKNTNKKNDFDWSKKIIAQNMDNNRSWNFIHPNNGFIIH
jgi:hypothetical protein